MPETFTNRFAGEILRFRIRNGVSLLQFIANTRRQSRKQMHWKCEDEKEKRKKLSPAAGIYGALDRLCCEAHHYLQDTGICLLICVKSNFIAFVRLPFRYPCALLHESSTICTVYGARWPVLNRLFYFRLPSRSSRSSTVVVDTSCHCTSNSISFVRRVLWTLYLSWSRMVWRLHAQRTHPFQILNALWTTISIPSHSASR